MHRRRLDLAIDRAERALRMAFGGTFGGRAANDAVLRLLAGGMKVPSVNVARSMRDESMCAIGTEFLDSYVGVLTRELSDGRVWQTDYGHRVMGQVHQWSMSGATHAAPQLQALLSLLAEDGHNVSMVRAELINLIAGVTPRRDRS